jgi:hypothetical protein
MVGILKGEDCDTVILQDILQFLNLIAHTPDLIVTLNKYEYNELGIYKKASLIKSLF